MSSSYSICVLHIGALAEGNSVGSQVCPVALLIIELLGSRIVGGSDKEDSIILTSFPTENNTKWFDS
jgi:hypothetical protein